jgi:hypothetical protein
VLLDKALIETIVKSMKKQLENEQRGSTGSIPMLYSAAVLSLAPIAFYKDKKIMKLFSTFAKAHKEPIFDLTVDEKLALEAVNGSTAFAAHLDVLNASHSHVWFILVLLASMVTKERELPIEALLKAFKPFVGLVLAAHLHSPSTGSHLHHLLLDFGFPVLWFVLNHEKSSVLSQKAIGSAGAAFVALAISKGFCMTVSQVELLSLLLSTDELPLLLVSQTSTLLQSLSDPEGTNSKNSEKSSLLPCLISQLRRCTTSMVKLPASEIEKVLRRLLRHGYEHHLVLEFIFDFLNVLPRSSTSMSVYATLHDLLVSHSSFVKILLTQEKALSNQSYSGSAQIGILRLLCLVYAQEPEGSLKFSEKMLTLYLSAYRATLAPQDQLLLHIIMIFEKHGLNFSHAGFLWGAIAQVHKSSSVVRAPTASSTNSANENGMDVDESSKPENTSAVDLATFHALLLGGQLVQHRMMLTTIRSFSPFLPMQTSETYLGAEALFPRNEAQQLRTSPSSVYDARFLLSVYHFGMNFFPEFDCKKFVETGGLSLVFQTLASFHEDLRKLGYAVLASYSTLLDKSTVPMREAPQLRLLISVLRAAIAVENLQLSSVTSSFLGEASLVLIRHDHPLFLELHNYLLSRPLLSLNSTPILKRFLVSSRNASKNEKEWALRMVECGLRSSQDLPLLGLRYGSLKASNHHILAMLISQLSSHLASSFSAISERHRIWSILSKMIILDGPTYKNTLLGPGGIAPFLALWTLNHSNHSDTSSFNIVPSAAIASPAVYAEVATILKTIVLLPELATVITKSRSLWLQFLPIIGNILHYLELSYAKLGSLHQSQWHQNASKSEASLSKTEDEENGETTENATLASNDSPSYNLYWKLLAPCLKLLNHFASNLSVPNGVPTTMLKIAAKLLAHLRGSYRPVCAHHVSSHSKSLMDVEIETESHSLPNRSKHCQCSPEHIESAEHYLFLANAVLMDKPECNDSQAVQDWLALAQFSIRIVLASSSSDSSRFLTIRTLLGQLCILATTQSSHLLVAKIAEAVRNKKSNESTLLNSLLFLYRQHPISSSEHSEDRNLIIVVLLNTLCTLITATGIKNKQFDFVHPSWLDLLKTQLPECLKTTKTLSANTLHEASLQQFCNDMGKTEKKSHITLASFYRAFLSMTSDSPAPSLSALEI